MKQKKYRKYLAPTVGSALLEIEYSVLLSDSLTTTNEVDRLHTINGDAPTASSPAEPMYFEDF